MKISKIILYDEPKVPEIQLKKLAKFVSDTFPVRVEIRESFFQNLDPSISEKIASVRIFDLKKPFTLHIPTSKEIDLEIQNKDNSNNEEMILYDGFEFQKIISESIPTNQETLQIIFTNKLTCTFDEKDFRYHARAIIDSNPSIISTSGIIEAPAKPKQYYIDLMTEFSEEKIKEIDQKYKGEFLEYHDSRLSDIAEGYVLQSIMYNETGEDFCQNKECRLFNAHWQKDLFTSQVKNKKFCNRHEEILRELKVQA